MLIHNIYTDLFHATFNFLNKIFATKINKVQYNISNQSFLMNYDRNEDEKPIMIFNLNNQRLYNPSPTSFQFTNFNNMNDVPILYNQNKNLEFKIREDAFEISVNIRISTISQLQSLEFSRAILNSLPPDKYLTHFKFTSFLEIDDIFFIPCINDLKNDKIFNLFQYYNKLTNSIQNCFSLTNEPLIKVSEPNITLPQDFDRDENSVEFDITYLINLPKFWISPKKFIFDCEKYNIDKHHLHNDKIQKENVKIPVNDDYYYFKLYIQELDSNNFYNHLLYINKSNLINNSLSYTYNLDLNNENNEFLFEANAKEEYKKFEFKFYFRNDDTGTVFMDEGSGLLLDDKYAKIQGDKLFGEIKNINTDNDNNLNGFYMGHYNNHYIEDFMDFEIFNVEFAEYSFENKKNLNKNGKYITKKIKQIDKNSFSSYFEDSYNSNFFIIDFNNTYIFKVYVVNNNDESSVIDIAPAVNINPDYTFNFQIDYNSNTYDINGYLNFNNLNLEFLNTDGLNVLFVEFDISFIYNYNALPNQISSINIGYNNEKNSILNSDFNLLKFEFDQYKNYNIIINEYDKVEYINNIVKFHIDIQNHIDSNLISSMNNIYYCFYIENKKIELENEVIKLDHLNSNSEKLVFDVDKSFFNRYLDFSNNLSSLLLTIKIHE